MSARGAAPHGRGLVPLAAEPAGGGFTGHPVAPA
jgi:hypothetical protein